MSNSYGKNIIVNFVEITVHLNNCQSSHSVLSPYRNKRQSTTTCHRTAILYGGRGGGYFEDDCYPAIRQIDIGDSDNYDAVPNLRYIQVTYLDANGQTVLATLHGRARFMVLQPHPPSTGRAHHSCDWTPLHRQPFW